jgi:pantothenate kinase
MARLIRRTTKSVEKAFDIADNLLDVGVELTGLCADVVKDFRKERKAIADLKDTKTYKDAQKELHLMEIQQEIAEMTAETAKLQKASKA